MMSNLVLNFDTFGSYALRINTGLPLVVTSSEEEFARVLYEVEEFAVPIYYSIVKSIIAFTARDKRACLKHVKEVTAKLRPMLSSYYDRVHNAKIARSEWLSRIQGFHAWAAGRPNPTTGKWETFDGLSGNQVLAFQVVDAFLGLESYLPQDVQRCNVPELQREFCTVVSKHSFRHKLGQGEVEERIRN